MRKLFSFLAVSTFLFISCDDTRRPQVVYDETISDTLTVENMLEDTTKVLVAGMPIYLDSTDVLIHPIGWEDILSTYKSRFGTDFTSSEYINNKVTRGGKIDSFSSFSVHSNDKDYISGQMVNLIFEDVETGAKHKLTDRVMKILTVSYLRNVWRNTGKQYLLYSVIDKDYNRDGKLDGLDMTSYYMSNLDGTNFTKITEDYHYFDTDQLILKNNRYYFRTLEDVNKDGVFNKKDKYHYYYLDLAHDGFSPVEYFPLELLDIQ